MRKRWETASRYYCVRVYRDLLGDLVVAKSWGGRRNNLGGCKVEPVADYAGAREAVQALSKRRARRRYRAVT